MMDLSKLNKLLTLPPWEWEGMCLVNQEGETIIEAAHPSYATNLEEWKPLLAAAPDLLAEVEKLREKLAQISICASNAQYGRLDMNEAMSSIAKAAKLECK
ncbi:MAG: hypothetical protein KOO63_05360 [Bacteroidales bacterium]|nr:hypothetical protein [Candidatus Latescibacterota bacterium]